MRLILEKLDENDYSLLLQGSQEQLIELLSMASSFILQIKKKPVINKVINKIDTSKPIEPKSLVEASQEKFEVKPIKLVSTNVKKGKQGRKPTIDLEVIREIKLMAQNHASDRMILEKLRNKGVKISLGQIGYWRRNTPKELVMT